MQADDSRRGGRAGGRQGGECFVERAEDPLAPVD